MTDLTKFDQWFDETYPKSAYGNLPGVFRESSREFALNGYTQGIKDATSVIDWDSEPQFDWSNNNGIDIQRHVDAHARWAVDQMGKLKHACDRR